MELGKNRSISTRVRLAPFGLVLQLSDKLSPVGVADMFCQLWIPDHALHIQRFNAHNLVLVNECTGGLVGSIHPAVGYFGMKTGNFESCSGSVVTAFVLFRQLTLKVSELLLIASGVARIAGFLPSDVMNKSVKPKSMPTVGNRHWFSFKFAEHGNKVPTSPIFADGNAGRL